MNPWITIKILQMTITDLREKIKFKRLPTPQLVLQGYLGPIREDTQK